MATSLSASPDDASVGGLDVDDVSRPGNGNQNGRRKSKSNEKKKVPQRGMGVAQLERLRLQERWKKMQTHQNPLLLQPHNIIPQTDHYFFPASFPDPTSFGSSSGGNGVGLNQRFLLPRVEHGGLYEQVGPEQVPADANGFGSFNSGFRAWNVAREASNKLSSMPNVNYYSEQFSLLHKEMRVVNGENLGCNRMRDKCAGCSFGGFNLGNKQKMDQEIEVLAVHRIQGSSSGGSSGHGSVLMEYEFFPKGRVSSTCSKGVEIGFLLPPEEDYSSASSSVAAVEVDQGCSCLATRTNSGGFGVSNSIDLSLKLS